MKKILLAAMGLAVCLLIFSACGKNPDDTATAGEALPATMDEATVAAESFKAEEAFTGDFNNSEYSAQIRKKRNDEIEITISSEIIEGTSYEWNMSGFMSDINYKIICDNVKKSIVSFNQDGKEKSHEIEYINGSSKIIFSDSDNFTWKNDMEQIENNEFSRSDKSDQ